MTGYAHPRYAESLSEFGKPRLLPESGGWILERQIPGFAARDGMGCYPLFACQEWSRLHSDLENIRDDLVTLAVVTDPFGAYDAAHLQRCFRDVVIPFKEHFAVDLGRPMSSSVCSHHRRNARRALRDVCVERCRNPAEFVDDWTSLYGVLVARHNIGGIPAFSKASFAKQLRVPGIVMFRGTYKETTVGMVLWYIQGDVGYYHLGAYTDAGYKLKASFALFWSAIEYFSTCGLGRLDLGAGAGVKMDGMDGLTRFKEGWSTGTAIAYFCGRIFDQEQYAMIVSAKGDSTSDYFPAYRKGEFG